MIDWGRYHSPDGKRAKALGSVTATGKDHQDIPPPPP
jgi:hypothetical protein